MFSRLVVVVVLEIRRIRTLLVRGARSATRVGVPLPQLGAARERDGGERQGEDEAFHDAVPSDSVYRLLRRLLSAAAIAGLLPPALARITPAIPRRNNSYCGSSETAASLNASTRASPPRASVKLWPRRNTTSRTLSCSVIHTSPWRAVSVLPAPSSTRR